MLKTLIYSFKCYFLIYFNESKIHTIYSFHKHLNLVISHGDLSAYNLTNKESFIYGLRCPMLSC